MISRSCCGRDLAVEHRTHTFRQTFPGTVQLRVEIRLSQYLFRRGQVGVETESAVHANGVRLESPKLLDRAAYGFQRVAR